METHLDKWLFLLRHLAELGDRPETLQESSFNQLFEVAELANFSRAEQETYQNSLKYYRDLNNVVNTSRQEGRQEGFIRGREAGLEQGRKEGERSLVVRLLSRQVGNLPNAVQSQLDQLSPEALEELGEALLDFAELEDLQEWLRVYELQDQG